MTKRCKNRVRSRGKLILNSYNQMVAHFAYHQSSTDWRSWSFRRISLRAAEKLVAAGEAEPVSRMHDGIVQVIGFSTKNATVSGRPTPTTLTLASMHAVTGGRPRLPGDMRDYSGSDRAQIIKVIVWPLIGDTKAVCVRPPLTVSERRYAEKVLAAGKLQVA